MGGRHGIKTETGTDYFSKTAGKSGNQKYCFPGFHRMPVFFSRHFRD